MIITCPLPRNSTEWSMWEWTPFYSQSLNSKIYLIYMMVEINQHNTDWINWCINWLCPWQNVFFKLIPRCDMLIPQVLVVDFPALEHENKCVFCFSFTWNSRAGLSQSSTHFFFPSFWSLLMSSIQSFFVFVSCFRFYSCIPSLQQLQC